MIYHFKPAPAFLFLLFLSVISCVEPITPQLNEDDSESVLVVDAQITNEEGPFKVKLTTSVPVNVMYYPHPVLNANVSIRDDHGNIYELTGDKQGKYETAEKNLKAVPGYTYTLEITTREGNRYESDPVTMMESPEIDSLYTQEVKHIRFEEGAANEEIWLEILLDAYDPPGITKFWNFEFAETWEVKVLTDHVRVENTPPGAQGDPPTWERILADEKKLTCWVTKNSTSIMVASTSNNPVDELKGFRIRSLGPGEDKLHIRYSILVKQSCISREQYEYRKQLMDANENLGGIYDKIPARVKGNILATQGNLNALGNFSVLFVKTKRLFIDKNDHHIETQSVYQDCSYRSFQLPYVENIYFGTIAGTDIEVYCSSDFCADCQNYGSNTVPDFWK